MQYPHGFGVAQAMLCKDCFSCRTCPAVICACAALALLENANTTDPISRADKGIAAESSDLRNIFMTPPNDDATLPIRRGLSSQLFPSWSQRLEVRARRIATPLLCLAP